MYKHTHKHAYIHAHMAEYIFDDVNFDKPMFLTAFSTSLFMIYLLGFVFLESWRKELRRSYAVSMCVYMYVMYACICICIFMYVCVCVHICMYEFLFWSRAGSSCDDRMP